MTNREMVSLPLRLEVLRPEGPGPFPAALLLHGCGGLQPMLLRYAQGLQAAGVMGGGGAWLLRCSDAPASRA